MPNLYSNALGPRRGSRLEDFHQAQERREESRADSRSYSRGRMSREEYDDRQAVRDEANARAVKKHAARVEAMHAKQREAEEAERRRKSVFEIAKEEFVKAVNVLVWKTEKVEEEEVDELAEAMRRTKIYN